MSTIKDIANLANVSHMTVSRALNDSPLIASKTKELILKIAKEVNYRANYSAKSLVTSKSYTIGVFFSAIGQNTAPSFFHTCWWGIYHNLPKDYQLIIQDIGDGFEHVNLSRVDGVIFVSQKAQDDDFIQFIQEQKVPLVVINRELNDKSIVNVAVDEVAGAAEAVRYLIRAGHNDIALINGPDHIQSSVDRGLGYQRALAEAEIAIDEKNFVVGDYTIYGGYTAMAQLLNHPTKPHAVFCTNDEMAFGALKAIAEHGLKLPNDITLVGYNDSEICQFTMPALSTVRKPIEEMAQIGCKLLFDLIENRHIAEYKHTLQTKLILRNSA